MYLVQPSLKHMDIANLPSKQLRKLASLKDRIASLEAKISRLFGGSTTPKSSTPKKKHKISAAGRARIAAAARARWAKAKGKKVAVKPVKRKMSAAARAKLAAFAKARWAKIKAAGKKAL